MATDDVKVVVVSAGKTPEDEDSTPVPIAVAATYQAQPIQQGGTVLNGSIGGYSMQATVPSLATMSAAVPSVSVALPGVAMQPAYGGVVGGCAHAQEAVVKRITGLQIMYAVLLLIFFWPLFWLPFVIPTCYGQDIRCATCGVHKGSRAGGTC